MTHPRWTGISPVVTTKNYIDEAIVAEDPLRHIDPQRRDGISAVTTRGLLVKPIR